MNKHCSRSKGVSGRMRIGTHHPKWKSRAGGFSMVAVLLLALWTVPAVALDLTVTDPQGNPVSGFRWLVEEDTTNLTIPGALVANSISLDIHNSYSPVMAKGESATGTVSIAVPSTTRYVVSVMPYTGYSISGGNVAVGQTSMTVVVQPLPIPTAQISIFVFEDHNTINNAPDLPRERGLEGFSIIIAESLGQQTMDAFGNPLGTTYQQNPDGSFILDDEGNPVVDQMGNMIIKTNAQGEALIKYLPPGKYGIQVIPPQGTNWILTSTIEGTPVVDAWVKANEPKTFLEGFGPGFYHAFFGFVDKNRLPWALTPPTGTGSISGTVVFNHFGRPPLNQQLAPGEVVEGAWVGLNSLTSLTGLYAAPCNPDGTFTISNVPPGTYQLVTWDENLDALFGFNTVIVPGTINPTGDPVALGNVLSYRWFGTLEGSVFLDDGAGDPTKAANGFRDVGEKGITNQNINIRFRDGRIYQSTVTDPMGDYSFAEVFPFFKWLVVEVDFARFKDTGMTAIVDEGGPIPPDNGWDMPSRGKLNPQPQAEINPNTGNNLSRTQVSTSPGEVLLQAMHLFLNQLNIIEWGKLPYLMGENGGISGVVFYATTRAENDPRYAVGDPWEPGIPRVQMNLYMDVDCDGVIDDLDGDGSPTRADVDNYPFDDPTLPVWSLFPGPEDQDWNNNGVFDPGDAIQIITTDCWDDNKPTGSIQPPLVIHGQPVNPGFDGYGTWNQIRPGVFDGGYAFTSYHPGGIFSGSDEVDGLPRGVYIVEAATPFGYTLVKEEDKNVDFGDSYTPSPLLIPPPIVGDLRPVQQYLSFQTDEMGNPLPGIDPADLIEAPFALEMRPTPDRKQVRVSDGKNAAADFFFFTQVPKAARAVGFVNNDLSAEFNAESPVFGEKAAPSWLPISFQDWAGNELLRIYSDEFGCYNAALPSTYTVNVAAPSGVAPQMLTLVLNHPGPIPDPANPGQMIIDPYYDPDYSQTPWTFNYYPGSVSYLDTPIVPIAAFVGYPNRVLDVEPSSGTPVIFSVEGPDGGPIVCTNGDTITITSVGYKAVPNPDYDPANPATTELITRDFGFGAAGGTVTVGGVPLTVNPGTWSNLTIVAEVDFGTVTTGQVKVTRNDTGKSSDLGVTLHVGGCQTRNTFHVEQAAYPSHPIQDAIDAASPGDLIIVHPGHYFENPILYKNVTLQGSGAESTILHANPTPADRVAAWHTKIQTILGLDGTDPFAANETPGIMVLGNAGFAFAEGSSGRIDGFSISGSIAGGGIYVHSMAHYLEISNNKIKSNQGSWGGGITVGTPGLEEMNTHVNIHNNHVLKNGGVMGGGGITIFTGADDYTIRNNLIMGNFTRWNGGGITHSGLSHRGRIEQNRVVSNEVFYGLAIGGNGGGIFVEKTVNPEDPGALGDGSGSVTILSNLIQGNLAGAGVGGGIALMNINGIDAMEAPALWYTINVFNNMIVNNVAGGAAGGLYLQNALRVNVVNNTIANNDSAATTANSFTPGNLLMSNPQPAGVVSVPHSQDLAALSGQDYTNPLLNDNIIWQNRSFFWDVSINGGHGGLAPHATQPIWDLAVTGFPFPVYLNPKSSILTSLTDTFGADYDDGTNVASDPLFAESYTNTLQTAAVLDEGGNFLSLRFNPIGINGDYHITCGSPAINLGDFTITDFPDLDYDFDGQIRPGGVFVDAGADEIRPNCSADLDVDGDVDVVDLNIFASNWMTVCLYYRYPPCDFNQDGVVNLLDFTVFASQFGQTNCCP